MLIYFFYKNIDKIDNIINIIEYNAKIINDTFKSNYDNIGNLIEDGDKILIKSSELLYEWNKLFILNTNEFSETISNFDRVVNDFDSIIKNMSKTDSLLKN